MLEGAVRPLAAKVYTHLTVRRWADAGRCRFALFAVPRVCLVGSEHCDRIPDLGLAVGDADHGAECAAGLRVERAL